MFDAVHKETDEPYYAADVWDKFENPHEEEWICCPNEKNLVTPVKEHIRHYESKNKSVWVSPHFQLLPNEEECNYRKETSIHIKLKRLVANLVSSEKLDFLMDGKEIPISELYFEEVENPEHSWVEKNIKGKRPDVKAKLKDYHPFIGKGIAFEVEWKSTRSKQKREKRTDLFTENGWSVIWINKEEINKNSISLKEDKLEISSVYFRNEVYKKVEEMKRELEKNFKLRYQDKLDEATNLVQNFKQNIDTCVENLVKQRVNSKNIERRVKNRINEKLKNPKEWTPSKTCRTCEYSSEDNQNEVLNLIACWERTKWENGEKKYPQKREPFDVCSKYEREDDSTKKQKTPSPEAIIK